MIQWIIAGAVALLICSLPIIYHFFGKEDKCGKTWWDRYKSNK